MKKIIFYCLMLTSIMLSSKTVQEELPLKARNYIIKHFPEQKIAFTEYKNNVVSKEYEVKLNNGIELEFNSSGDIEKIEGENNMRLPDSVVPAKILEYVKNNYPDTYITEWEMEYNTQEVKLSIDLSLDFDKNGNFVRIDK